MEKTVEKVGYVLAVSILLSTIIFSLALLNAAATVAGGLKSLSIQAAPSNGGGTVVPVAPTATPAPSQPSTPPANVKLDLSGRPVEGSSSAKVTLAAFDDLQCPFCARAFTDSESQIKTNYIDTGKVKLVFLHFPLYSIHPNAGPFAEDGECVSQIGGNDKFWQWRAIVYNNNNVVNVGSVINDSVAAGWAQQVGVDVSKYNACVASKQYDANVQKDYQQGISSGVSGTPTFYVIDKNGKSTQVVGAQPYSVFQTALDAALAA